MLDIVSGWFSDWAERSSMIVGGLVMSQLLTLCTTPVIYLCLDHLRLWVRRPARIRQPRLADERLPEPGE
jgi:hypothetical protein